LIDITLFFATMPMLSPILFALPPMPAAAMPMLIRYRFRRFDAAIFFVADTMPHADDAMAIFATPYARCH